MQEFGRFYFLNEYGQELVKVVEANLPRNSRLNNHTPSRRERRETLSTRITLLEKPVGQLCNTFQKTSAGKGGEGKSLSKKGSPTSTKHRSTLLQRVPLTLLSSDQGSHYLDISLHARVWPLLLFERVRPGVGQGCGGQPA